MIPLAIERIVWAYVPKADNQTSHSVLIEDMGDCGQAWCIARSVGVMQDGKVPLCVCNPSLLPLELPFGCGNPDRPKGHTRAVQTGAMEHRTLGSGG